MLQVNKYHGSVSINRSIKQLIDSLYTDYDREQFQFNLLLRTSRKIINYLTTEDGQKPSAIFTSLMIQNSSLSLVITLLKIVLICQHIHSHLEIVIAQLIRYHEKLPESQCQSFINFLEVFDIVFALYTENVQYSLVQIQDEPIEAKHLISLEKNRIFSQIKGTELQGINLSGYHLKAADFSLAKLSKANLSHTCLEASKLILTDLQGADLSYAQLKNADSRRAQVNRADLSYANLCEADLSHANLNQSNLHSANLNYASARHVNFCGADLRNVQFEHSNLFGSKLDQVKVQQSQFHNHNSLKPETGQQQLNRGAIFSN